MISFHCEVCRKPILGLASAASAAAAVLIQRQSTLMTGETFGEGLWLKGVTITAWNNAAAGTGRFSHVHRDACLAKWIERHGKSVFEKAV